MEKNGGHYNLKEIGDLRPHPENPREVLKAALEGLKYSIDEFGDLSGIVWNERNGYLVCGHQRVKALQAQGAEGVWENERLVWIDLHGERFPIRVVDWPDDKHKAAMMTANNEAIQGRWTVDAAAVAKHIRENDERSYAALRIAEILKRAPKPPRNIVDDQTEVEAKAVTKPGDVWTLGQHRIVCGDTMEVGTPADITAVITDPPYSERTHAGMRSGNNPGMNPLDDRGKAKRGIEYEPIDIREIETQARRWCGLDASWIVVFTDHANWFQWHMEIMKQGWYTFGPVGWVKSWAPPRFGADGPTQSVEWIAVARSKGQPTDRRSRPGHYMAAKPAVSYLVGQKAVPTMAELIEDYSQPGDLVCDPYLGTGTTLLACEQTDRRCFGVEMEPARVDLAIERWQNLTGEAARRG